MGNGTYSPKDALRSLLSDTEREKFKAAKNEMTAAEQVLADREWEGDDTSFARDALYELDYWVSCNADVDSLEAARSNFQDKLHSQNPPSALAQDPDGSFGTGASRFFLKLDRSTDQILARAWPWPRQPIFLQPINDPMRMVTYLHDLCWSDIARCRRDNRKELNLAISVIARLVIKGGQAGYLSAPSFYPAFERFVLDWQDAETGFFGVTYITDPKGNQVKTTDLSLTFHMARYVPHLVRSWPTLIDTLFAIEKGTYPEGWLDLGTTMTDHNNYDVATLFLRGWIHMTPQQRAKASAKVEELVDWCLTESVMPNGSLKNPDNSDPVPDSYYFAAAFLDTVGYFDASKRFWTDQKPPGDPEKIKSGMISQLRLFNPYYTEIDDALFRLGAPEHPWTNAIL